MRVGFINCLNHIIPPPLYDMSSTSATAGRELFDLVKNSKLAQVSTPRSKLIRFSRTKPTHQTIYTPTTSALRSDYGMKRTLPAKYGKSHIAFNDIDNAKEMPDVEKESSFHYTRLMFQELGKPLAQRYSTENPLFASASNKSNLLPPEYKLAHCLNLPEKISTGKVLEILRQTPDIYRKFRDYMAKTHPEVVLTNFQGETKEYLMEFLKQSAEVQKEAVTISTLSRHRKNIEGTAGFSYNQRGRLQNTPNGIKYETIAPGRMVGTKEAAIAGLTASVAERSAMMQYNYASNAPGKHSRQFNAPYQINDAELAEDGSVRVFALGVKVGNWSENDRRYAEARKNMSFKTERNRVNDESLENLLNLILPKKK